MVMVMTATSEAIKGHATNPDAIVEAGELTDWRFPAGGQMTLRAAKVFHLLIQGAGVRITENREHRMTYASLNEVFHITIVELEEVIDELQTTLLKLKLTRPDGTKYTKSGPILADAERDDQQSNQAELRYTFSPTLQRAIQDSRHWAVISKQAVLAFQSKYALRLYTLISLRVGLRKTSEAFLLDDLRNILGIPPERYPLFGNLKQKVLVPAIAEINHLAGFQVGFQAQRHGRSVVAVKLFWGIKNKDERIAALKELERTKVGRKARRDGKAELIASDEQITRHEIALAISQIEARNISDVIE
jgi:hypothetical protein